MTEPRFIYRVSWRYPTWAEGYWRCRYCSYRHAKLLAGRITKCGGQWRVDRPAIPTNELGSSAVAMRPQLAGDGAQ